MRWTRLDMAVSMVSSIDVFSFPEYWIAFYLAFWNDMALLQSAW